MSSLHIVEVCKIESKRPHPNADRLEFIRLKGWDVLVQKSINLQANDPVVFIPPGSVITPEYAEKLGITKYCCTLKKLDDGTQPVGLRVKAARLRGEASYGTIDHEVDPAWEIGKNVADILKITKWEPPIKATDGDAMSEHPSFHRYTDIENIRNFPDVIKEGEEVVFTEKLHGKNCRIGAIWSPDEEGRKTCQNFAGSHDVNRKPKDAKDRQSDFWKPHDIPGIKAFLVEGVAGFPKLNEAKRDTSNQDNIILFGELINTQKGFNYGQKQGEFGFRVFDISVNMKYMDYEAKHSLLEAFAVPMVPVLYRGPFSWAKLEEFTNGNTTVGDPAKLFKFKGREGIVVTPVRERFDPTLSGGRVILKSISIDYLEYRDNKGAEEVDQADH